MSICYNKYSGLVLKSFLEQAWYNEIKLREKKFVVCCDLHHFFFAPGSERTSRKECIIPIENGEIFRLSITGYALCLPLSSVCKFTQKFVTLRITLSSVLVLHGFLKAWAFFWRLWSVALLLVREYIRNDGVIYDNLFEVRFWFLRLKYILIPIHILFSLCLLIHWLKNRP